MKPNISQAAFTNLNLVRAISGLVVVFSHYFQIFVLPVFGANWFTKMAIQAAEYAVLAFFILSGFLIALSLERNCGKNGYFEWKEYFISRVSRIYPALIASACMCILLYKFATFFNLTEVLNLTRNTDVLPPARTQFLVSSKEFFYTLWQTYAFGPGSYISINGPLWSLSYEVGFYICAGLFWTILKGCGMARIFSKFALGAILGIAYFFEKSLFFYYGLIWSLGIAAFLFAKFSKRSSSGGFFKATYLLCLFAFSICVHEFKSDSKLIYDLFVSVNMAFSVFFISQSTMPILKSIAKLSESTYSLYLFHFPIMLFLYGALLRDIFELNHTLYALATAFITILLVPVLHWIAKFLENRWLWEQTIRKFLKFLLVRQPSSSASR